MPASISSEPSTEEAITIESVHITREDIFRCRFSSWYGRFRDATFKSRVIPLPKEFIDYLNADGIYLPDEG
jgi:D123